ncbi:DUF2795 domain-containing protein [Candidatus Daviesbacteria bacterium]|nr:DUF2795 domain-containing protein [Candidatus Daviesbacteria bacterium]
MQNIAGAMDHLKNHQMYPATKEELVKTCNELSDFSKEDKQWFMENLPAGTYESPEEVMMALGWSKDQMSQAQPSM